VKMGRTWLTSQSWMLSWKSASCLNRYPCKRHVAFQGHKRNVAGSSPGCSCFHSKFWMYNVWERLRLFVGDFPIKSSAEPVAPNLRSLLQAWQLHISTPKVSTRRLGQFPFGMGNDGDKLTLVVSDVSALRNVANALCTDLVDLNLKSNSTYDIAYSFIYILESALHRQKREVVGLDSFTKRLGAQRMTSAARRTTCVGSFQVDVFGAGPLCWLWQRNLSVAVCYEVLPGLLRENPCSCGENHGPRVRVMMLNHDFCWAAALFSEINLHDKPNIYLNPYKP
jgi:hypothetical protein